MVKNEFKYKTNRTHHPNIEFLIDGSWCKKGKINVAIFYEHRLSFYYWLVWENHHSLFTIDWHEDLTCPKYEEFEELNNLNLTNYFEVYLYTMYRMSYTNDTQIKSAMWHDTIKNVYVLSKKNEKYNETEFFDKN